MRALPKAHGAMATRRRVVMDGVLAGIATAAAAVATGIAIAIVTEATATARALARAVRVSRDAMSRVAMARGASSHATMERDAMNRGATSRVGMNRGDLNHVTMAHAVTMRVVTSHRAKPLASRDPNHVRRARRVRLRPMAPARALTGPRASVLSALAVRVAAGVAGVVAVPDAMALPVRTHTAMAAPMAIVPSIRAM